MLRHKHLRVEWARKYLKMDMSLAIFTDATRVTLDGPDGWVYFEDEKHRRQQQGGGVMIWGRNNRG